MDGIVRVRTIAFTPDRMPMLRRIRLGYEGDNLVERLEFDLPEIAQGQTATLMITGADAVKLDRTDEGRYAVNLTKDMIGPDGEREAYVRIDGAGEKIWQSAPMRMVTGALPDVEEDIEKQYPTAVGQMLTAMAEHSGEMAAQEERVEQAAQRAEEAAERAEAGGGGSGSGGGAVEIDATLTQEGKAADAKATGEAIGKLSEEIAYTEPKISDIPKVFLTGDAFDDMTTAKNEVKMKLEYISATEQFTAGIKIKYQGNSSLSHAKKNFTIKLYENEECESKLKKSFRGWGSQNKYVLKANFIDHSHARNIVSARLWSQIVASRADYDALPQEMQQSPNNCAVDGFPIKLYVNGIYHGLYTWNIPKDAWMFGMDEDNANHCVLCAEYNNSSNPGTVSAYPTCEFRALWGGNTDTKWAVEVPDTATDAIVTSFNDLIACVKDTDDDTFMSMIENHLDLQSAIDYYLYAYFGCFFDNLGKNLLMMTFDGKKWYCGMYDMDNTWGLRFTKPTLPQPYNSRCPEDYGESYSLLWQRLEKLYYNRLKERYAELRAGALNVSNAINAMERFMDVIPADLLAEDVTIYPDIYFPNVNPVRQMRSFIAQRTTYVDAEIAALDGSSFCDRDGDGIDDYIGGESPEEPETPSDEPLYPLTVSSGIVDGAVSVEVTNGNHVRVAGVPNGNSPYFIDCSFVNNSVGTEESTSLNSLWFSIPAGANVHMAIKNISERYVLNASVGLRKVGGASVASIQYAGSSADVTYGQTEVNVTTINKEDVSYLLLYYSAYADAYIEFDVELTVDGVRYI